MPEDTKYRHIHITLGDGQSNERFTFAILPGQEKLLDTLQQKAEKQITLHDYYTFSEHKSGGMDVSLFLQNEIRTVAVDHFARLPSSDPRDNHAEPFGRLHPSDEG